MDLAVYISELLGLHGEVNVPEIGYFAQTRTNGYYNKQENKFYPPGHDISFQPQFTDDDSLAKYISAKKNISLASSKYFIDKYIQDVKQIVAHQKVDIAGLGYLQLENSTLNFKASNVSRDNDPTFYGFQPVKAYRVSEQSVETYVEPQKETEIVKEEPVPVKEAMEEIFMDKNITIPTVIMEEEAHEEPEYIEEEETKSRFVNIWVVLLLFIAIVGLGLIGVYQYYPSVFDKFMTSKPKPPVVKPAATNPAVQPAVKPDTQAKTTANPPTPAATSPQTVPGTSVDSSKLAHFEISGGVFDRESDAEKVMKNYKSMGFDARVLDKGKGYRITLGTYYTRTDADAAEDKILSTKKISKKSIYIQYYKAKK